jgi:hypothetical protein
MRRGHEKVILQCRVPDEDPWASTNVGVYKVVNGRLYYDISASHVRILSFCIDDLEQGCVVQLPMFVVK